MSNLPKKRFLKNERTGFDIPRCFFGGCWGCQTHIGKKWKNWVSGGNLKSEQLWGVTLTTIGKQASHVCCFFFQKCAYRSCWDLLGMAPRCVKHVVYCVCIILAIVFVDVTMSEPGLSQSAVSCHDLPCSTARLEISYHGDTRKSSIHRWIYIIGHAAVGVSPVSGNPSPSTGWSSSSKKTLW